MSTALLLINPKFPHNVGGALRAAAAFGASELLWSGDRVPAPESWPKGARLPREERIKAYRTVAIKHEVAPRGLVDGARLVGMTPVCVEIGAGTESLPEFEHPPDPLYVFGPEDGGVPKGIRTVCHRFVQIPSVGCLNLAAATNIVLYDRLVKLGR